MALTHSPGFSWSPDGASMVFAIERDGVKGDDLFVAPVAGGTLRRLTRTPRIAEAFPAWSPDGSTIAYEAVNEAVEAVRYRIWVIGVNGANRRRLSPLTDFSEILPTWAPNGKRMAFLHDISANQFNIYSMAANGSARRRLTRTREEEQSPAWSPNGTQIAFTRSVNSVFLDEQTFDLWVMQSNGTNQRRVVRNVDERYPTWSPDGTKLAFVARGAAHVLDLATGATRRIAGSAGADQIAWSPDGTRFAATIERSGRIDLYVIPASGAGTGVLRLTNDNAEEVFPAWSPDGSLIGFARSL